MALLTSAEYNISYFDGKKSSLTHNAGFGEYERWYRVDGVNSLGEFWKDKAKYWFDYLDLKGKKVLELGCAKGFMVEDWRDMGVDAYGMDISSYALDCGSEKAVSYLYSGDVRSDLTRFADKEFDVVISFRLIECLTDKEVTDLISSVDKIAKQQVHIITTNDNLNTDYYNFKTLDNWLVLSWPKGTILASYNNETRFLIK